MADEHEGDVQEPSKSPEPPAPQEPRRAAVRARSPEPEPAAEEPATPETEASAKPNLHQYDPKKAEYPGQPRIPERDEGGVRPPTLDEIKASEAMAAGSGETVRDRHAYQEAAGVYVYQGDSATVHTVLGVLEPNQEKDFRGVVDPNVLKLLSEQADALGLKKQ